MFPPLQLKHDRTSQDVVVDLRELDDEERAFSGIRCPQCTWRPSPSSRWCCDAVSAPEPAFAGCGTTWNTFATGGRCPGCGHQWQWTSCLRCAEWSRHMDWYEEPDTGRRR